ncbi:MAG: hypothetical protein ACTHLZ_00160, partial [Tepidisphaeraceae bacterium]
KYRLDLPNAAVAAGASNLTIYGTLTGAVIPATTINLGNVPADVRGWLGSTPNGLNAGYVMADMQSLQGDPDALGGLSSLSYDYTNQGWVSANVSFWLGSSVNGLTADNRLDVSVGSINDPALKFPALLDANDVTGNVPANVNAITGAVQAALALAIQAGIIDETDGQQVLAAIVAKINATDVNLADLTAAGIAAAVWQYLLSDATAAGSLGKFLADLSVGTIKLNVGTAASVTGNIGGSVLGNVAGSIGSISGVTIVGGFIPVDADALAAAMNATEQQMQLAANAQGAYQQASEANQRIGDGTQDTDVARKGQLPTDNFTGNDRLALEAVQEKINALAVDDQGRVTTANPAAGPTQIDQDINEGTWEVTG